MITGAVPLFDPHPLWFEFIFTTSNWLYPSPPYQCHTPQIWGSFYILFALLCSHTANMKLFKKSLLGNMRSRIDLDSYSQFTAKWNWVSVHETFLIGLRSETKWWLFNSAPDACIVTEQCMWQYASILLKACGSPLMGIFYVQREWINFLLSTSPSYIIILKARGTMTIALHTLGCL